MQFSLRTLLLSVLAVPLGILILHLWDGSAVVVADGAYSLNISIIGNSPEISSISYATIDSELVQTVIENYPAAEPTFHNVVGDAVTVCVPWSSKTSRIGRDLGYCEAFDTILFRIVYQNQTSEFRTVPVPDRNSRTDTKLEL